MKKVRYICDVCSNEFELEEFTTLHYQNISYDLCPNCNKAFYAMFKRFIAEKPEAVQEQRPVLVRPHKAINDNKVVENIIALYKNGENPAVIAVKFDINVSAVRRVIDNYEKYGVFTGDELYIKNKDGDIIDNEELKNIIQKLEEGMSAGRVATLCNTTRHYIMLVLENLDKFKRVVEVEKPVVKKEVNLMDIAIPVGLDIRKIVALANAGWTVKNIAGEMSCDQEVVRSVLFRCRKKKE